MKEPTKMKCTNCGYEWNTMSDKMLVTCPSCIRKTIRIDLAKISEKVEARKMSSTISDNLESKQYKEVIKNGNNKGRSTRI